MNIENPLRLVRELKGAPLSILIVLGMVKTRVTQEYLERATGYTDKPVSQALEYMREIGLVDHTSSGWQLTRGAAQLPLTMAIDEGEQADHTSERAHSSEPSPEERPEDGSDCETSRKYSDSNNYYYPLNQEVNSQEELIISESRKNSDSLPEVLSKAGITGKALKELSTKPHLSADIVRRFEHQLKKQKGDLYTPGLLVVVLRGYKPGDRLPEKVYPPGEEGRRYIDGEFANWIEH